MKKQKDTIDNFDNYLKKIEDQERRERRKKALYAFLILAIVGGGVVTTLKFVLGGNDALATYMYAELDYDRVNELLMQQDEALVVIHPEMGRDTITTPEQFASLSSVIELMERTREAEFASLEQETEFQDTEFQEESDVEESLPVYIVDLNGSRVSGQELTFTIEDYDSRVIYTLDLGNGERKRIRKEISYVYPEAGNYRLRLFASRAGYQTSVYTKRFEVGEGGQNTEDLSQIASAETSSPYDSGEVRSVIIRDESARLAEPSGPNAPEEVATETLDGNAADEANENSSEPAETTAAPTEAPASTPNPAESTSSQEEEIEDLAAKGPYYVADVLPRFPGGSRALGRYFQRNSRYPEVAQAANIEGNVYVRFVVNEDGSLSDINVFRGLGYGCDEEAIRLIKNMPRWIPGRLSGQKVPVYKELPITFRLVD